MTKIYVTVHLETRMESTYPDGHTRRVLLDDNTYEFVVDNQRGETPAKRRWRAALALVDLLREAQEADA